MPFDRSLWRPTMSGGAVVVVVVSGGVGSWRSSMSAVKYDTDGQHWRPTVSVGSCIYTWTALRSYAMSVLLSSGMGDRLWAGKPPGYYNQPARDQFNHRPGAFLWPESFFFGWNAQKINLDYGVSS